jgi:hypothetical protein
VRRVASALLVVATAGAGAGVAAGATAGGGWSRPVAISPPGALGTYPVVAYDGRGRASAVWTQLSGPDSDYVVMTALRSGRRWSKAVALSRRTGLSLAPVLAVNGSGAAVAAWDLASGHAAVEAATRGSGSGEWPRRTRLSPLSEDAGQADAGIDATGGALVAWTGVRGSRRRIAVATAAAGTRDWSDPETLATARRAMRRVQVAVAPSGAAIVTWVEDLRGGPLRRGGTRGQVVAAARAAAGGPWSRPAVLGPETEPAGQGIASFEEPGPRAAIDAAGRSVIVWQGRRGGRIVPVAVSGQGGIWSRARAVAFEPALLPHVAVDPAGGTTVVWQRGDGAIRAAAAALPALRWSRPRTLARVGDLPRVATDPHGDAIATWTSRAVDAAIRRGPGGRWRRAFRLGAGGVSQAAMGPRGQAIVVWQHPTERPRGIVVDAAAHRALR